MCIFGQMVLRTPPTRTKDENNMRRKETPIKINHIFSGQRTERPHKQISHPHHRDRGEFPFSAPAQSHLVGICYYFFFFYRGPHKEVPIWRAKKCMGPGLSETLDHCIIFVKKKKKPKKERKSRGKNRRMEKPLGICVSSTRPASGDPTMLYQDVGTAIKTIRAS